MFLKIFALSKPNNAELAISQIKIPNIREILGKIAYNTKTLPLFQNPFISKPHYKITALFEGYL